MTNPSPLPRWRKCEAIDGPNTVSGTSRCGADGSWHAPLASPRDRTRHAAGAAGCISIRIHRWYPHGRAFVSATRHAGASWPGCGGTSHRGFAETDETAIPPNYSETCINVHRSHPQARDGLQAEVKLRRVWKTASSTAPLTATRPARLPSPAGTSSTFLRTFRPYAPNAQTTSTCTEKSASSGLIGTSGARSAREYAADILRNS